MVDELLSSHNLMSGVAVSALADLVNRTEDDIVRHRYRLLLRHELWMWACGQQVCNWAEYFLGVL